MRYDTDFAKWVERQTTHLTEGRFELLDVAVWDEAVSSGRHLSTLEELGVPLCLKRLLNKLKLLCYTTYKGGASLHRLHVHLTSK